MVTGIHHVSLKCSSDTQYRDTVSFYKSIMGLRENRELNGGVLLDTGNGLVEIFSNGTDLPGEGSWRHVALAVDEVDGMVESVRNAGYPVTMEPRSIDLGGLKARIAFVKGPLGEDIELFCVLK